MSTEPILCSLDDRGVATLTLNRPQVGNAYDGGLIQGLLNALDELRRERDLRVVVLKGAGRHFQAGADLAWVRAVGADTADANLAASRDTARAVDRLNRLPVPTIALVHGASAVARGWWRRATW
jgi:methylglutaconyl-CoA hydratase